MSLRTPDLHARFLAPFDGEVLWHSDPAKKPLEGDLGPPSPLRFRAYVYNLIAGVGTKRDREFKVSLRVPGQVGDEIGSFSHEGGRVALLVGICNDLDVFVLWDASLHPRFKSGWNLQVKTTTVLEAAALGYSEQMRRLTKTGATERVLACQSSTLAEAVTRRVLLTGGEGGQDAAC